MSVQPLQPKVPHCMRTPPATTPIATAKMPVHKPVPWATIPLAALIAVTGAVAEVFPPVAPAPLLPEGAALPEGSSLAPPVAEAPPVSEAPPPPPLVLLGAALPLASAPPVAVSVAVGLSTALPDSAPALLERVPVRVRVLDGEALSVGAAEPLSGAAEPLSEAAGASATMLRC